jgi:hypothetical protein
MVSRRRRDGDRRPVAGRPCGRAILRFAPPPQAAIKAQLKLWGTRYWVHAANASTAPRAVGLRKPNGSLHGVSLTAEDFCHAALEGTVRVTLPSGTAQVFNYAARGNRTFVDCAPRFPSLKPSVRAALGKTLFTAVPADAPFGLGVANFRLVPYRTVAVTGPRSLTERFSTFRR